MKVSFHGYIKPLPHLVNSAEVEGDTIRECLAAFAERYPNLREDFYDDEGRIGDNYAVFLDREMIHRDDFDRAVPEGSEIHIVMLFSGG